MDPDAKPPTLTIIRVAGSEAGFEFSDLKVRTLFRAKGNDEHTVYYKIKPVSGSNPSGNIPNNAVDLTHGHATSFYDNSTVYPVKGQLHLPY